MPDRRREPTVRKLVLEIERAADPKAALGRVTGRLDCQLKSAELELQQSEALLAELTEKLEHIATARRAAKRARGGAYRLRREQHEEQLRAAHNARRRQRYRERAESHPSGAGRPVRIEVDATAWRSLRAEAARRRTSAKQLLGEIARGLTIGFDPDVRRDLTVRCSPLATHGRRSAGASLHPRRCRR